MRRAAWYQLRPVLLPIGAAATTCAYLEEPNPAFTPSASEQVFGCREAFVVETFEILEVLGSNAAG